MTCRRSRTVSLTCGQRQAAELHRRFRTPQHVLPGCGLRRPHRDGPVGLLPRIDVLRNVRLRRSRQHLPLDGRRSPHPAHAAGAHRLALPVRRRQRQAVRAAQWHSLHAGRLGLRHHSRGECASARPGTPGIVFKGKTAEAFVVQDFGTPVVGSNIQLQWTPGHDLNSTMVFSFRYTTPGNTTLNSQVYCQFRDNGTDSIPTRYNVGVGAQHTWVASRIRTFVAPVSKGGYRFHFHLRHSHAGFALSHRECPMTADVLASSATRWARWRCPPPRCGASRPNGRAATFPSGACTRCRPLSTPSS